MFGTQISTDAGGPIAQMEPWFDGAERDAVSAYFSGGGWMTEFRQTEAFERQIAEHVGSKHCVVVANGTVSLATALFALGVGPGDEVIVPDLTMFGSVTAVMLTGARPVLVDVARDTLCLDLGLAEQAITPATKAIMVVSLHGRAPDMAEALRLCERHGLRLLEDAAQSLGSRQRGKHLGSFGDIGSFSFSAPKIITTGQGGALVTDDDALAKRMRQVKDFGRVRAGQDFHEIVGFNFKFTDLQAVVGIEQMKKLPARVERKKAMFGLYRDELADVPGVEFLPTDTTEIPVWFIDIYVPRRDELRRHLAGKQIGARPIYPPMHSQDALRMTGDFPVTDAMSARGLWLPSSAFLSDEQVRRVCAEVRAFFAR